MTALTLADFLRARLDEDEAVARLDPADGEAWDWDDAGRRQWHTARCGLRMGEYMEPCSCDVRARVLADVEAKRQIVEEVARPCPTCLNGKRCVEHDASAGASTWRFRYDRDEHLARLLALPYADHPDYDEGWRA